MRIYLKATCILLNLFFCGLAYADDELNLQFIHGSSQGDVPDIFRSDVVYPSGEYIVDIFLNDTKVKRQLITISPDDQQQLCLPLTWLEESGIFILPEVFSQGFDSDRQCYVLTNKPGAKVIFNHNNQSIEFTLPQAYLDQNKTNVLNNWDFGISGAKFNYHVNANKSDNDKAKTYGNFNANINIDRWVLSSRAYRFSDSKMQFQDVTLSTPISLIRGDFILGKTQTMSTLLNSFTYSGAALRSNNKMQPTGFNGYAPVITGVANSSSRITVEQSGSVLNSLVVPAGPYSLRDISPITNGDLVIRVVEDNGTETVRIYPVTTLPTLLRSGDFNYNFVVGSRDDFGLKLNDNDSTNKLDGVFGLASLDYGFDYFTINSALLYHNEYRGEGLGLTLPLGSFGALAISGNASQIQGDTLDSTGYSAAIKYSKSIGSRTNLQLVSYEYVGDGYYEFQQYYPGMSDTDDKKKNRYEAVFTHSLDKLYANLMLWKQTYRNKRSDIGAGVNLSTNIKKASFALGLNYNDYGDYERSDYQVTLSTSIPLMFGEKRAFNSSSLSYSRSNKTSFNTNVSGDLTDDVNYVFSANKGRDTESASAQVGARFDALQTGAAISQGNNRTTISGNMSGSILATGKSGVLFTNQQSQTVAIARVENTKGIKINNSRETNAKGYAVIPMNEYSVNTLRINTDNLRDDVELMDSTFDVVPTEKAIVYREFGIQSVKRYILRLSDSAGNDIPRGLLAKTADNTDAGFVSDNGVLLMNLLSEPQKIKVSGRTGFECSFSMQGITSNIQNVQEVICE